MTTVAIHQRQHPTLEAQRDAAIGDIIVIPPLIKLSHGITHLNQRTSMRPNCFVHFTLIPLPSLSYHFSSHAPSRSWTDIYMATASICDTPAFNDLANVFKNLCHLANKQRRDLSEKELGIQRAKGKTMSRAIPAVYLSLRVHQWA